MENLVPDEPEFNLECITHGAGVTDVARINPVDAIAVGAMPTNAQVCAESRRSARILAAQLNGGLMTEEEFSNSIVRNHRVIHTRSGMAPNAPAITQQLTQMQEQLTQIQNTMNAQFNASNARSANNFARSASNWTAILPYVPLPYVPVVKYMPEHPFQNHPNVPGVQFNALYPINSQPPANLMPDSYDEIGRWRQLTVAQLTVKIRGIYWFYNDPRFIQPNNANLAACQNALETIDYFLRVT